MKRFWGDNLVYLEETKEWIKIFVEDILQLPDEIEDIASEYSKKVINDKFFGERKKVSGKMRYAPKPKTIALTTILIALDNKKIPYNIDDYSNECSISSNIIEAWKKILKKQIEGD